MRQSFILHPSLEYPPVLAYQVAKIAPSCLGVCLYHSVDIPIVYIYHNAMIWGDYREKPMGTIQEKSEKDENSSEQKLSHSPNFRMNFYEDRQKAL